MNICDVLERKVDERVLNKEGPVLSHERGMIGAH